MGATAKKREELLLVWGPYSNVRKNVHNRVTEEREKAVVSLLIPEKYWKGFQNLKREENKSSADIFEDLLEKHQRAQDSDLANRTKLTTQYQDPGLDLTRHSFWVDPLIWHRFKNIARFYGVSICFLFTALLRTLGNLVTNKKKYAPLVVKLYEKVKIPLKTATRSYRLDTS